MFWKPPRSPPESFVSISSKTELFGWRCIDSYTWAEAFPWTRPLEHKQEFLLISQFLKCKYLEMTPALKQVAKCQEGRQDRGVGRAGEGCRFPPRPGAKEGTSLHFGGWGTRRFTLSRVWSYIFLTSCIVHIYKSNVCSP